jgi:large subunit ribosomal protein L21
MCALQAVAGLGPRRPRRAYGLLTQGVGLCSDEGSPKPGHDERSDMEAVIATGGKQYRVAPGQLVSIEKVPGEKGAAVEFRSVLLVTRDGEVIAGEKALSRAKVSGEVVAQGRRRKVVVVKFKRRKNYRRNRGHRQAATTVRITSIEV